jgi:hypothetical protein
MWKVARLLEEGAGARLLEQRRLDLRAADLHRRRRAALKALPRRTAGPPRRGTEEGVRYATTTTP